MSQALATLKKSTLKEHSVNSLLRVLSRMPDLDKSQALELACSPGSGWTYDTEYGERTNYCLRLFAISVLAHSLRKQGYGVDKKIDRFIYIAFVTILPSVESVMDTVAQAMDQEPEAAAYLWKCIPLQLWLADTQSSSNALQPWSEEDRIKHFNWLREDCFWNNSPTMTTNELACQTFAPQFHSYSSVLLDSQGWSAANISLLADAFNSRSTALGHIELPLEL